MPELSLTKVSAALDDWYEVHTSRGGVPIVGWDRQKMTILRHVMDHHRVKAPSLPPPAPTSRCPGCGVPSATNHAFCKECGTSLGRLSPLMSNPNRRITIELLPEER